MFIEETEFTLRKLIMFKSHQFLLSKIFLFHPCLWIRGGMHSDMASNVTHF